MQFHPPLVPGTLIKRYKRFLADVELDCGSVVTAHCANTGAMTGCAEPGFRVWLSYHSDPSRKLAYSWQLAEDFAGNLIGINTLRANQLVREALEEGRIGALSAYRHIRPEVRYGEQRSRIDLLLRESGLPDCYVEIKSVTLLDKEQGFFPDAVTERGRKHLQELMQVLKAGHRAVLLFCVQHTGITSVRVAEHIDAKYAALLAEARRQGLEILVFGCQISPEKMLLNQSLDFVV